MSNKPDHIEFKSARFNLRRDPDRQAVEIIQRYESEGVSFKKLARDAILMMEGYTPEMFADERGTTMRDMMVQMEDMFATFAQDILGKIKSGGGYIPANDSGDDDSMSATQPSKFARNLASGFVARQSRVLGADDE